jgi:predicted ArsR family transcriptional regulator
MSATTTTPATISDIILTYLKENQDSRVSARTLARVLGQNKSEINRHLYQLEKTPMWKIRSKHSGD